MRQKKSTSFILVSLLAPFAVWLAPHFVFAQSPSPTTLDFQKQIRPIFEKHCLECHGDSKPESGLRLTNRTAALADADSGKAAIVPGKPDKSMLIHRITSDDDDERMPPESKLSEQEIELLKKWISDGAHWNGDAKRTQHWAYIAPQRPPIPKSKNDTWGNDPIDRFIHRKLVAAGLKPSAEQDPARLVRRLYFALIGLPPSPQQVTEFVSNPTDENYARIVDRLLASQHYGERWAQPWLDLARYADSNGFQADQLRDGWAYRDWVIDSINRDMSFDQFTIEQLAGDLLPHATTAQKIATGFHRAATCNVEAGVHPEQNRINQIFDRVNTTGTVFLGTTIECAQCHNHKYDPFTQDEYYQLFAFFNNTPIEVKLQSGVRFDFYGPNLELPLSVEKAATRKKLVEQRDTLQAQLKLIRSRDVQTRKKWEQNLKATVGKKVEWLPLTPIQFDSNGGETHRILKDKSILIGGSLPGTSIYNVTFEETKTEIRGIKFEVLTDPSLPGSGPGRGDEVRSNFILSEFNVESKLDSNWNSIDLVSAQADFSQTGWPVAAAIDGNRKTGWAIAPKFHKSHWAVFQPAKPIDGGQKLKMTLDQNYGRGRTIGRFRILVTADEISATQIPANIKKILLAKKRNPGQTKKLNSYFESTNPEIVRINKSLATILKQLEKTRPDSTLVMVEMKKPRETRKLMRGDYLDPGKLVKPGVPSILHSFDTKKFSENRLGLARWLVDPKNPLVARVAVNRWWSQFFGQGMVSSLEDFGIQSEPPTHPDLLDWLAVVFVENQWSRKHIHRLIVTSSTFRQSAKVGPRQLSMDPKNQLYSRGPRIRMTAEMVRDNGLAVSKLLSLQKGGKPVMPYQPNGIWRAVGRNAPKWTESTGEQRYRRGIYVVWRRAAPYPSFVNFDAPDRAACVVSRPSTNTPLQALTLLNDYAFLEMALALADTVIMESGTLPVRDQLKQILKRCVAREPETNEIDILERLYHSQLKHFEQNPDQATRLLSGIKHVETKSKKKETEMAAMTVVANAVLNLDETINY